MLKDGSDGAKRSDIAACGAVSDAAESLAMPRLSARALAGLGRDELLGVLSGIERLANRLAGYRAEVLGALEVLSQSGVAPDVSPHLSLRDAAGVSERDARRMVRAAEKARQHGIVLEALSEGDINASQAETLCDARVPDPVRAELVVAAAGEDTDADAAAVNRLHAYARARSDKLPDGPPPSRRVTPRKSASKRTSAECEQPDNAIPEANAVKDEGLAFGRQLPPAQVSVLIGLDALRSQTDEMGLTDAGVELPPEIVRHLACDAEIIPIILNSPGGSADAGRSRRSVSLRLRRLLVARDRHCRWPGCGEPPSRCDAHHIWHWIDGGPTNLDNLVLLCHRHHHFLHQHGYKMVPRPDGTWTTIQESEPKPSPRRSKPQARAP